jgi:hypothetical protein
MVRGLVTRVSSSVADDRAFRRWWAKFERHIHSPGSLLAFLRLQAGVDVRAVLPSVRSPTWFSSVVTTYTAIRQQSVPCRHDCRSRIR